LIPGPCSRPWVLYNRPRNSQQLSVPRGFEVSAVHAGGSVTQWIGQLKAGEELALEKLRQRYWPYLVGLARKKLKGTPRRAADEEDVAQEAFWSFYRSFKAGRLPRLESRGDLFALLTIITARRAASLVEREGRLKRGGGHVRGESALEALSSSSPDGCGIEQVPASGVGPEEQAQANDTYNHFLAALDEPNRDIAEMWLAGWSHRQIAQTKQCAVRTIDRKVRIILDEWQKVATDSVDPGVVGQGGVTN